MSMEGINWDEVNTQAAKLIGYFYHLNNSLLDRIESFEDELSPVWASGNAVTFGENVIEYKRELCDTMDTTIAKITNEIEKAKEIYRNNFNVSSRGGPLPFFNVKTGGNSNKFNEIVNGITGMNKTAAKEVAEQLKADVTTILDDFTTNINSIRISIYDTAEAQQDAFASSIDEMKKIINEKIDNIIYQINNGIDTEIDRVDLVKSQTVNTFNA